MYESSYQSALVQGFNGPPESAKSLRQIDLELHDEINAMSFIQLVLFLVQDDDDVSRLQSRLLIALTGEGDLLSVLHSLVDRNLENLPLSDHLAAVALLATQLRVNPLALSLALSAHGLDLLHHPRAQLLDSHLKNKNSRQLFMS